MRRRFSFRRRVEFDIVAMQVYAARDKPIAFGVYHLSGPVRCARPLADGVADGTHALVSGVGAKHTHRSHCGEQEGKPSGCQGNDDGFHEKTF